MNQDWLHGVYDDYRSGDRETVAAVRALQRKVAIGCASPRDCAVLKGLDRVHVMVGQDIPPDSEASIQISDSLLQRLLDLVAQARRPASVNLMTAGTSPMRRHGGRGQGVGPTVAGLYEQGPFFGDSRGGAAARSPSHAMVPSGGGHPMAHHGVRHRPGGGFASWIGSWGIWPDDCYLDVYGRIWCWGPWGWQVVG